MLLWLIITVVVIVVIAGIMEALTLRKEYKILEEHLDRLANKMTDKEKKDHGMDD